MLSQSTVLDELARQRVAELDGAASETRLPRRTVRLPRARAYVSRMLIALGTRLAPTEARATNHVTKLAGR